MKSSLLVLLAATTLSFASMGSIHAQEANTIYPRQSTECGGTPGDMGAPSSLMDDSEDHDSMNTDGAAPEVLATRPSTDDDTGGTCCLGKDGKPDVHGVDADCPAGEEPSDDN